MALRLNLCAKDEPKGLFAVRMYPSTREELGNAAAAEGVSMQQLVLTLINDYLDSNRR